jgi:hypothetical protein
MIFRLSNLDFSRKKNLLIEKKDGQLVQFFISIKIIAMFSYHQFFSTYKHISVRRCHITLFDKIFDFLILNF